MSEGKEKGIGFGRGGLTPGPAGKNHLLVIAIDDYVHCPKLHNCVKDATDFEEVLRTQYEFEPQNTLTLYNEQATRANIHAKLRELRTKVKPQDNLVIFFSGHGEVDGEVGYWVPVEADPEKDWEFIETSALKNRLNAINSFHTFLIVDACFSGSLFATYKSVRAGYETKRSRLGLAASHSRERALDGTPGENSPFAQKLLKRLRDNAGSLSAQKLATDVIEEVQAATRGRQTPVFKHLDVKGDDSGQFVFHSKSNEAADWATCRKVGTLEVFQAYLKKYPEGKHRVEAEQQITFLKEESAWQQARKDNRIQGYLKYRREYKEGRYREQALEAIKELEEDQAWQLARSRETIFGFEQYLDKYPKGKYRKDAEAAMDMLLNRQSDKREREAEDQKWEVTRTADTVESYQAYLQAYPGGKYSVQAKSRITELEALALEARLEGEIKAAWEQVKDSRSIAALEGFRKKYPDHRYAVAATRLIDQIREEQESSPPTGKKPPPAEQEISSLKKYWPWLAGVAVLVVLGILWGVWANGGQSDDPASQEDLTALEDDTPGLVEETTTAAPSQDDEEELSKPPLSAPNLTLEGTNRSGSDRRNYRTISVNGLTWMTENLNLDVPDSWCYDDDPANCAKYGRLYSWEAAQKACRTLGNSWRLPTDEEWRLLAMRFGGYFDGETEENIGDPEASHKALIQGGNSGFAVLLSGYRNSHGNFLSLGNSGGYWSATDRDARRAWSFNLNTDEKLGQWGNYKDFGFSCRCVQP